MPANGKRSSASARRADDTEHVLDAVRDERLDERLEGVILCLPVMARLGASVIVFMRFKFAPNAGVLPCDQPEPRPVRDNGLESPPRNGVTKG
jgi:hypothetical protein